MEQQIRLEILPEWAETETACWLGELFGTGDPAAELTLRLDGDGVSLCSEEQVLRSDFHKMLPRVKAGRLGGELLVRAAKIKGAEGPLTAVDATAGLGEDSFLLAAAGFQVTLFEKNPVVYALLRDGLDRARNTPELSEIASRMTVCNADSICAMGQLDFFPDVVLLDPMFPERQKSALVKKKLQMIQKLEQPCMDDVVLLLSAMETRPKKLIVKRPPKGPHLGGIKPDHAIEGKAVRYDCFASPYERLEKFKEKL